MALRRKPRQGHAVRMSPGLDARSFNNRWTSSVTAGSGCPASDQGNGLMGAHLRLTGLIWHALVQVRPVDAW